MDELQVFRSEIDSIDDSMIDLFQKRMDVVRKVAEYKKEHTMQVSNPAREQEVISKNLAKIQNEELKPHAEKFVRSVIQISKDYEHEYVEA